MEYSERKEGYVRLGKMRAGGQTTSRLKLIKITDYIFFIPKQEGFYTSLANMLQTSLFNIQSVKSSQSFITSTCLA